MGRAGCSLLQGSSGAEGGVSAAVLGFGGILGFGAMRCPWGPKVLRDRRSLTSW